MNFIRVRSTILINCVTFIFLHRITIVTRFWVSYSIISTVTFTLNKVPSSKPRSCVWRMIVWSLPPWMAVLVRSFYFDEIFSVFTWILGYNMFDSVQRLVKFLKESFEIEGASNHREEEQFRRSVIDAIGQWCSTLLVFLPFESMHCRRFHGEISRCTDDRSDTIYHCSVTHSKLEWNSEEPKGKVALSMFVFPITTNSFSLDRSMLNSNC